MFSRECTGVWGRPPSNVCMPPTSALTPRQIITRHFQSIFGRIPRSNTPTCPLRLCPSTPDTLQPVRCQTRAHAKSIRCVRSVDVAPSCANGPPPNVSLAPPFLARTSLLKTRLQVRCQSRAATLVQKNSLACDVLHAPTHGHRRFPHTPRPLT
jgi:hypothetical protein